MSIKKYLTRLILSREANTAAQMNRGLSVREQLRYAWRRGSVSGFVNYRSNTPSLESLILRNPALLPLEYRAAFLSDPQGFLLTNRNALPLLLNGIQLPLTRNQESGIRIQSAFSRVNVNGEAIYSVAKFMASEQRTLRTTVSASLRLDAANTVQVNASRAFRFSGTGSYTGSRLVTPIVSGPEVAAAFSFPSCSGSVAVTFKVTSLWI